MRVVGLDVSRTFAEIAYLEDGCNLPMYGLKSAAPRSKDPGF
jgi:hypothetical protein